MTPADLASHSFEYVFPSEPQTGSNTEAQFVIFSQPVAQLLLSYFIFWSEVHAGGAGHTFGHVVPVSPHHPIGLYDTALVVAALDDLHHVPPASVQSFSP